MRISDWSSDVCSSDLVELLQDLLRAAGYYEARVERLITAAPEDKTRLLVTFTVDPGKLFTYAMVDVTGVEPIRYDEVRGLLKLQSGDPVDTARTQAAELGLKTDLPRHGYVFSNVGARSEEHTSELQSLL